MEPSFAAFSYFKNLRTEVAKEGKDEDYNHVGKLLIKELKKHESTINQIDGYTGLSETNGSFLRRTQHFAQAMLDYGLNVGDVILISGYATLDIFVPYTAAFYIGVASMPISRTCKILELENFVKIAQPKMIICPSERVAITKEALANLNLDSIIITQDHSEEYRSIQQLIEEQKEMNKEFRPLDFDGTDVIGTLTCTSGTSGVAKGAALSHQCILNAAPLFWTPYNNIPKPIEISFATASLEWITTQMNIINGIVLNYTRLQTSIPQLTREHCYDIINKYKPEWMLMSPAVGAMIGRYPDHLKCDLTCLKKIHIVGSAPNVEIINLYKKLTGGDVMIGYGMTEFSGMIFATYPQQPTMSCGTEIIHLEYKLVDIDSGKEITEPNTPGELHVRGNCFKFYYNNPEATKEMFTSDGWVRTGDIFYRDANNNYYFTDRLKLLMKYKGCHVSPTELENLISTIPGILDVVVTFTTDRYNNDLPVACVTLHSGATVTDEQIKNIVKDNLSDGKQLRGGVVYMQQMPMLPSTKVDRAAVKKFVNLELQRKINKPVSLACKLGSIHKDFTIEGS